MENSIERGGCNLTRNEIGLITRLLGPNHCYLCSGIGQLAISRKSFLGKSFEYSNEKLIPDNSSLPWSPTSPSKNIHDWKIILKVGVLLISQHEESKKYYIQAIDMANEKIAINHLIEPDSDFKRQRRFILTFETKLGTFCLNFVDDDEADYFTKKLEKIMLKYENCYE